MKNYQRGLRNNSEHPRQWRCHRVEFWCCCWFDCDTQNLLQRWRVLTLAQPLKAWTSHTLTFCSPFLTVGCSESARATRTNLWHVKVLKENSVRFTLMEKPKIAHSGKKTMMIARFVSVVEVEMVVLWHTNEILRYLSYSCGPIMPMLTPLKES